MSKEPNDRNQLNRLKQQLEQWEKEGYDASELKAKWHKEIYEGKPSHNKPIVVSSFIVGLIIISIGLGIYYGTHKGENQAIITSATPTPTSTPISELTYNGTNEDWQEAINWINDNTPYPHNVILQFTSDSASTFMIAQDELTASALMNKLGYRYIAIDYETAYSKYPTMLTWSGENVSNYYEIWYKQTSSGLSQFQVFYPAYYKSMCARLYNFRAAAVIPNNSTWVLSYTEETDTNGGRFKKLTGAANNGNPFTTYEEAAAFVNDHPGYIIVGTDPFVSPIPLEALKEYQPIHSSPSVVLQSNDTNISYVEIFEYTSYAQ